jgi:uracil-DNA glycosylase
MFELNKSAVSLALNRHFKLLKSCTRCPRMHKPVVVGRIVANKIILVGQAPGDKEPIMGRPFAWTAGKTLFKWFNEGLGWSEEETRNRIYFAAVCRCFPGKKEEGGDRVPNSEEISNCAHWLRREFALLKPDLVIPVGKLAITQFLPSDALDQIIGKSFKTTYHKHTVECIPLPHPSGASPWHRMEPGKSLIAKAFRLIADNKAIKTLD